MFVKFFIHFLLQLCDEHESARRQVQHRARLGGGGHRTPVIHALMEDVRDEIHEAHDAGHSDHELLLLLDVCLFFK